MNALLRSLDSVCRERPLDEKWLLAPSRRVGYQWLDHLALTGVPVLNVRVRTVKFTAFDLAFPLLAERGLSTLSENMALFLVTEIFARLAGRGSGYLLGQAPEAGLFRKIYGALNDLRLAGLSTADLKRSSFEDPAKAVDLALLAEGYLEELERRRLVDYAGRLGLATERLRSDPLALPGSALLLVPGDPALSVLERRLLESVDPARLIRLETDSRSGAGPLAPGVLTEILSGESESGGPRLATGIFRAVGEPNEVREVFRRILARGLRLDQVEVLHTDPACYVPLFFELGRNFTACDWNSSLGVPVTFAEGVPVRLSRPGRALAAWLEWIGKGYPQAGLVAMIQDGLLETGTEDGSFGAMAALLRRVPIGLGRGRYLSGLDNWIVAREHWTGKGDEGEDDGEAVARRRRLELARGLRKFAARLIEISPAGPPGGLQFLIQAEKFLKELARSVSELDKFSRKALLDRIEELKDWIGKSSGTSEPDVRAWLADLPDSLSVEGSNPSPGCLHLANLRSGGHSGRPVTFILGLDDSRFPGAGLQDPVLLDAERARLSPGLPTAAAGLARTLADFSDCLAGLRGSLHLGFSCRNLEDNRGMFPSPLLLHIHRCLSGEPQADQGRLLESLPAAVSFAPLEVSACLDPSEWWLHLLCGAQSPAGPRALVEDAFKHLKNGRQAMQARESGRLTGWDGWVPEAGRALDPTAAEGRVMSASGFETLGRCPLAFFYRYGLELSPPDEYEADPGLWLDSLQAGTLLHEVFRGFMARLIADGGLPEDTSEQRALLSDILGKQIELWRRDYPPAGEAAFRRRLRELARTATVFLAEEAEHCRRNTPVHLEWAIGMEPEAGGEGAEGGAGWIVLSDGRRVRVRGRIDRVDRTADGAYSIWDYKTGGASRYSYANPFRQGRVVQPALYLKMAERPLRRAHGESARCGSFGFFFPGPRERGRRMEWRSEQLEQADEVLGWLCDSIAAGAFIATDKDDRETPPDCRFCDFQAACQDLHATVESSFNKLSNLDNVQLEPFRRLRGMPE